MKQRKIAVVMGGPSAEREVSLNTGQAIVGALQEKGYNAIGIDLDPPRLAQQLQEQNVQVVFNAIHGRFGEDGLMQGMLEMLGIPYTGSGVLASAMAMDKAVSKRLFQAAGIPTPRSVVYSQADRKRDLLAEILEEFRLPVVIKAATQGSTIGVVIVEQAGGVNQAVEEAFRYSDHIVVEEFIKGRELTVAVLGNESPQALPVIEIVPHSGCYDYHSKYTKGATEYIVPAVLPPEITQAVQQVSLKVFRLLGCKGIGRVDIMLDEKQRYYVLEINTIPGMTATSLVPKAAAAQGVSFGELCERILLTAI
ncbi:MAG TPA: D-alanine--D-alanine ligase [Patescibacteria group bacterium]|nr:D-alanine--D-alanine ligase [Patescibacteria group bacterium]